mgnify:CR=1 FL=1
MESIIVYLSSVAVPSIKGIPAVKICELKKLAEKERVELVFKEDWCRIYGEHTRKVKVPKKAIASSEGLAKWTKERILSAWGKS